MVMIFLFVRCHWKKNSRFKNNSCVRQATITISPFIVNKMGYAKTLTVFVLLRKLFKSDSRFLKSLVCHETVTFHFLDTSSTSRDSDSANDGYQKQESNITMRSAGDCKDAEINSSTSTALERSISTALSCGDSTALSYGVVTAVPFSTFTAVSASSGSSISKSGRTGGQTTAVFLLASVSVLCLKTKCLSRKLFSDDF